MAKYFQKNHQNVAKNVGKEGQIQEINRKILYFGKNHVHRIKSILISYFMQFRIFTNTAVKGRSTKILQVFKIGNNCLKVVTLTRWFPYTQWRRPQSIFDAKPRISIGMVSINFQNYQSFSYIF